MHGKEWILAFLMVALAAGGIVMGIEPTTPYAFLFDAEKASDEEQRFLNALLREYEVGREELEPLVGHMRRMGMDLPVLVYMADESQRPLADIVDYRKRGLDWLEVRRKIDLPLKPLFAGVTGSFPEPYKEAWVEYRMKYRPELHDTQIRELVLLHIVHRMTDAPLLDIARQRAKGTSPEKIVAAYAPRKEREERKARLAAERAAAEEAEEEREEAARKAAAERRKARAAAEKGKAGRSR